MFFLPLLTYIQILTNFGLQVIICIFPKLNVTCSLNRSEIYIYRIFVSILSGYTKKKNIKKLKVATFISHGCYVFLKDLPYNLLSKAPKYKKKIKIKMALSNSKVANFFSSKNNFYSVHYNKSFKTCIFVSDLP